MPYGREYTCTHGEPFGDCPKGCEATCRCNQDPRECELHWPRDDADPEGAALLDRTRDFLRQYVAFPSEHASVAVTLWAAHTHLADCFDSTPRLAVLSPEKQSGKTRILELLELLCMGAEFLSDASASFVFRRIGAGSVTVLLDECDAIWKRGGDDNAEALRSIVNAGHRRRATVGRVEMQGKKATLVRFPVYAPVALAGIGSCLPDTILDRSVIVRMRRRAPGEHVDPYRERMAAPEAEKLHAWLTDWSTLIAMGRIGDPWPEMPPGVADRPADVWEPLLAAAEAAGGHWPELARAACVHFVAGARDDVDSVRIRLLSDLRDVFGDENVMSTAAIRAALHAMDEAPWGDWYGHPLTARELAKLLKEYGVKSRVVRIGDTTAKGYRREDLWDAWSRYLPPGDVTQVTSVTPLARDVTDVTPVTHDVGNRVACASCGEPMIVIEPGQTTHPSDPCATTARGGASTYQRRTTPGRPGTDHHDEGDDAA